MPRCDVPYPTFSCWTVHLVSEGDCVFGGHCFNDVVFLFFSFFSVFFSLTLICPEIVGIGLDESCDV